MLIPSSFLLQRRGASSNAATAYGTIVTSGANANGLILRTISFETETGGRGFFTIGGFEVFYSASNQIFNYRGPGILVAAGQAVAISGTGAVRHYTTWDAL
jgi:hypothetical protein